MKQIIAFGGSNSKNSINKKFAKYVAGQLENVEINLLDLNDFDLPMYGIDYENEHGMPADAARLNELIDSSDGLIISLAEHNGSYTVAFKNAYDWMSRIQKEVWKNKPMLLMAASPGGRGGRGVLQSASMSFPHLRGNIISEFSLPKFHHNFSEEGLLDEELNDDLNQKIQLFQSALS